MDKLGSNPIVLAVVSAVLGKVIEESAGWVFYLFAVGFAIWSFWQWIQLPRGSRSSLESLLVLTLSKRLPLRTAAILVYEEALESGDLLAEATKRLRVNRSEDGTIDYIAAYFTIDGIQMWGRQPPSRRSMLIPEAECRGGHIIEGGRKLIPPGEDESLAYHDLYVSSSDIKRVFDRLRSGEARGV